MCSPKLKLQVTGSFDINGRPVLQPTYNRVPLLERRNSLKKNFTKSVIPPKIQPLPPRISSTTSTTNVSPKSMPSLITPPISPKLKSPRQPAIKQGNDPNKLSSSTEKVVLMTPRSTNKVVTLVKKSKKIAPLVDTTTLNYLSSSIVDAPGSIAAAMRDQVANTQVQRKSKIAHYGRTKSARFEPAIILLDDATTTPEEKRCSFITSSSDPIYVAYHDEEWGVPVHDDRLLFELLALTGAQVGSDWTSVLKKRQEFRDAFSEFDAETVSKFSEKKITSISTKYFIAMKKDFGSFDKYLWGFVNHKPIATQCKSSHKMPVKASKAESISKDMVKKGFRLVGPTVIHSFMQAAGITNDHLTTCPQHLRCLALASHTATPVVPAL